MALSAGVLGIFEQLELLEGLLGVSKPINDFKFLSNELKSIGYIKGKDEKDEYVYIPSRPARVNEGASFIPHSSYPSSFPFALFLT